MHRNPLAISNENQYKVAFASKIGTILSNNSPQWQSQIPEREGQCCLYLSGDDIVVRTGSHKRAPSATKRDAFRT